METALQINVDLKVKFYSPNLVLELLRKDEKTEKAVDVVKKVITQDSEDFNKANFLLCIKCKYPITRENNRIQINEKHQHVFANPQGHVFRIGCFSQAPGCFVFGEKTSYFTWFPGYTWQTALCAQCGALLGWAFQSKEFQFFGLILDNIKKFDS